MELQMVEHDLNKNKKTCSIQKNCSICLIRWAIGNEMYGEWQLGHVPFNEYRERHIRFSEAMRAVSSNIKLVGVGALHLPVEKETHSVNLDGINPICSSFFFYNMLCP